MRNEEIRHSGQWPASAEAGRIIYDKPKSDDRRTVTQTHV